MSIVSVGLFWNAGNAEVWGMGMESIYGKEKRKKTKVTFKQIEYFLRKVDKTFLIPLSDKTDLSGYALKLEKYATICAVRDDNGKILSMCAGYTDRVIDEMGYITLVATLQEVQRHHYGKKLIKEFLEIAGKRSLRAVHVYTARTNRPAMEMYEALGFQRWFPDNETRSEDMHFIYRF